MVHNTEGGYCSFLCKRGCTYILAHLGTELRNYDITQDEIVGFPSFLRSNEHDIDGSPSV